MKKTILIGFIVLIGSLNFISRNTASTLLGQKKDSAKENPYLPANPALQDFSPQQRQELESADSDILGDKELARPEDPSFESVSTYLPAMKRPREVVGVKHHPHDIGVAPDGSLELSDDVSAMGSPVAFFEVGRPAVRFGSTPPGCLKKLAQGYLPIVEAGFDHDGLHYTQTIFGFSESMSPDSGLWAYVALEAKNPSQKKRAIDIKFRIVPVTGGNSGRVWKKTLLPDRTERVFLKIPFDLEQQKFQEISEEKFSECLRVARDFWTKDLSLGTKTLIPEERVQNALRAWLAYASLDVDKRNGILEPHDGAGFYEQIYGYSAALYPNALDLWGRHHEARQILESLLEFQAPDGLFYLNFGLPDPGTLIFALSNHYELTGDAEWLRRVASKMIKMCDWIIKRRREAMIQTADKKSVTHGLIKFRPYCDYQEPAFDYFGDTYCAVGLEKTARALAALGEKDEARRIGKEAASYRRDILRSMNAAVIEKGGMKILPMEPDTHRLLKSTDFRAGGYYGLISSCMLESEFLPAADERAAMVMRFLESKGALRLGMSEFGGGIDHAYTYGYWLNSLKLDRVKPVILGFYGSLAYGMSRETHSGVEVTRLFTGENEPTLPHLYSCTQQLRLLRMMLVREEGDDLWIGQAVPRSWLKTGNKIEVSGAPTKFGPVSFSIESNTDRGEILANLTAPERKTPQQIFLRLRHPDGKKIKAVRVNGKPMKTFSDETLTLPSPRGTLQIQIIYEHDPDSIARYF